MDITKEDLQDMVDKAAEQAVRARHGRVLNKIGIEEISAVDSPANERRVVMLKRDSGAPSLESIAFEKRAEALGLDPSHGEILRKAYSGDKQGVADLEALLKELSAQVRGEKPMDAAGAGVGKRDYLQEEVEQRYQAVHAQEIDAGCDRYTSKAAIYTDLIENDPTGRALYKQARDERHGYTLDAPVAKSAPLSPFADQRPGFLEETQRMGKNADIRAARYGAEQSRVAKARNPADDDNDDSDSADARAARGELRGYTNPHPPSAAPHTSPRTGAGRPAGSGPRPEASRKHASFISDPNGRGGYDGVEPVGKSIFSTGKKVIGAVSPTVAQLRGF